MPLPTRCAHYVLVFLGMQIGLGVSFASDETYFRERQELLRLETEFSLEDEAALSEAELAADAVLMKIKAPEMEREPFLPAEHFFDAAEPIRASPLFDALRRMPKGAVLHTHVDSNVDLEWLIEFATYDDDLYICGQFTGEGKVAFRFLRDPAAASAPACDDAAGWRNVQALRKASSSAAEFDAQLIDELSMVTDRRPAYPDLQSAWDKFSRCFVVASGLIFYDKVHLHYIRKSAELYRDDGVQSIEIRHVLQDSIGKIYDIDGNERPHSDTLRNIQDAFTAVSGISVRVIFCMLRSTAPEIVAEGLRQAQVAMRSFPELVVGFDLVGQEDPGRPLVDFVHTFLTLPPPAVPTFFHAGETDWALGEADDNLYDAILLNTTRIGHGYGLARHPVLRERVVSRGVALEVCPLSNQVLALVEDLRDHPFVQFIAEGLPVTVSPDDPALWGATGVTFDWFQLFLASGNTTGIGLLKRLAVNSLEASALEGDARTALRKSWAAQWDAWIEWLRKSG